MRRYITLLALLALAIASCGGDVAATTTTSQTAVTEPAEPASSSEASVAQVGDTVQVHYVGTLDDGTEFDSSRDREPLEFLVGSDQLIAGFDQAVQGLAVGDMVTVRIPPEEAYGSVDPELIFSVPIDQAPDNVAVGDEVLIGGITPGVVTAVSTTEVTIDTNPKYAGQALTFEIEVISITQ